MEFPVKMMSKTMYDTAEKVHVCIYDENRKKGGEALDRSNIYWYRLCNDGTQETIISERANRNENQNKECETIDENKKPRNKRKKVVIKQIEE